MRYNHCMIRKIYPAPVDTGAIQTDKSSSSDIASFVKAASQLSKETRGRLIFGMDATMSRQPTWDKAVQTQASMFTTAGQKTGLSVQLVYFRGYGECRASKWVSNAQSLATLMTGIECRGGTTQLSKVLSHASREHQNKRVSALVFIGDAMEEDLDSLCQQAGKLGAQGVKAFMFQEGNDKQTETAFREIARLSNGAYMRFDQNAAKSLEELLSAVAAYATGGRNAMTALRSKSSQVLLEQLKR